MIQALELESLSTNDMIQQLVHIILIGYLNMLAVFFFFFLFLFLLLLLFPFYSPSILQLFARDLIIKQFLQIVLMELLLNLMFVFQDVGKKIQWFHQQLIASVFFFLFFFKKKRSFLKKKKFLCRLSNNL